MIKNNLKENERMQRKLKILLLVIAGSLIMIF